MSPMNVKATPPKPDPPADDPASSEVVPAAAPPLTIQLLDRNHQPTRTVTLAAPPLAIVQIEGVNYSHVGTRADGTWTFAPF